MSRLKSLLVQLLPAPGPSSNGSVRDAPGARFKLSVERIRAQKGSLLDQLVEDAGDGAAGLAIETAGSDASTGMVRIPYRDPPLFAFAMEVYRWGCSCSDGGLRFASSRCSSSRWLPRSHTRGSLMLRPR